MMVEGNSDFSITGDLGNYIPYILRNKTLKANLALHSNMTDVSAIMKAMSDSTHGSRSGYGWAGYYSGSQKH